MTADRGFGSPAVALGTKTLWQRDRLKKRRQTCPKNNYAHAKKTAKGAQEAHVPGSARRARREKQDDWTTGEDASTAAAQCPEPKKLLAVRRPCDELRFGNSPSQSVSQPSSEAATNQPEPGSCNYVRCHGCQSPLAPGHCTRPTPKPPLEGESELGAANQTNRGVRTKHDQKKTSQEGYTQRGPCAPLRQQKQQQV
ncbi:hypothetical protein HPB50_023643 [Hyalomma asiaticum]|uniref:Uncharacterized protein n=1 Tax=Hyalomma asiaticum TaxID=266040 RepID=A0ACB7T2U3_HYAAI|nr:hypothetical protein HPB50_023643 [Hyalomma asiaticum]